MSRTRPRPLHHVLVTIGFLTRIPVDHAPDVHMGRVASLFPVIGACIGGIAAAALVGAHEFLPMGPAAALALITGVIVTGAFHLDGLADSADALVGGTTPDRRLEILRDPRHGTYGVAAIVGQLLVQFALISSQSVRTGAVMLVIAHSAGRATAVSVMKSSSSAHEGLGAVYVRDVTRRDQVVALAVAALLTAALLGPWGFAVLAVVLLTAGIFARRCSLRIGGLVGDVLGATEQIAESLLMIGVLVLADHLDLWWM